MYVYGLRKPQSVKRLEVHHHMCRHICKLSMDGYSSRSTVQGFFISEMCQILKFSHPLLTAYSPWAKQQLRESVKKTKDYTMRQ